MCLPGELESNGRKHGSVVCWGLASEIVGEISPAVGAETADLVSVWAHDAIGTGLNFAARPMEEAPVGELSSRSLAGQRVQLGGNLGH